jgi:2-polyprenyl-6-methoxyphenol hydroxylase-like FAD-dependent oxidoreductase
MSKLVGRRAVVIGAGIGGLSMAGVLAEYFEQVHILERDHLAISTAQSRAGTPQDRHPTLLMAGGLKVLGEMFPGFEHDLASAGAVPVHLAQDFRYERADFGLFPMRDLGLSVLCASRPLIEFVLRRRVMAIGNVSLRPGCKVRRILSSTTRGVVEGVEFDSDLGRSQTLDADLVVDASGRCVPTLGLLDALGWKRPETTDVNVDISYVTAVVEIPVDAPSDWKLAVTLPNPPSVSLNAVLLPMEGGRWIVTVVDYGPALRPRHWDDFLDLLKRLNPLTIYDAVRNAAPPSDLQYYGFPTNVWRHFERLPRLPRGVLPVADALCRFNPIHGQGMTVAAKQAQLLQVVLKEATIGEDLLTALQTGFMAQVDSVVRTPWEMSTSADLAFPATRGKRPENFEEVRKFEYALFQSAVADPIVQKALTEVFQLLKPQSSLREPDILQRIEAVSSRMSPLL